MQDRPICFQCDKAIETNGEMVFEAPCGHEECHSAVFHAICLFDWREVRTRYESYIKEIRDRWIAEHQGLTGESEE